MFIVKDSDNRGQTLTEAEELKPSCEVHGGNLFVQLHFKAVKAVPDSAELINTVVTSRDESSAKFSGCGKHLVAVSSTDEETPLTRDNAVKHIKAYLGTMFGQDVSNSLKDDEIHTIDEKGQEMNADALKKWEEQQKEKGDEDKESIDESIPSFGKFILDESDDDIESETALDSEEDDGGGDGMEDDGGGGDDDEDDGTGDGEEGEAGRDEDEDEEAGDELPPPATYLVTYTIKADGQPETDHTDPKEVEKLSPKGGRLKLPGSNFNLGIEFKSGGATVDTIDLKKAANGFMGKVDSDEIEKQIKTIMRDNFPDIDQPSVEVRDQKTIGVELKRRISDNEISRDEYNGKAQALIANADYSLWIEVKDYREKPFIGKKDIADVINAAVKEVGGRWAKLLSGVKEDGVIMLHGFSAMNKQAQGKGEVRRLIPTPSEIQAFIKKNKSAPANIWTEIDNKFKACEKKNGEVGEAVAMEAIGKWKAFKKNRDSNSVTVKDYESFYSEYKEFYKNNVESLLSEEFISERELMQEIFGILYEDDGGEKPGTGSETSGGGGDDDEESEEDDGDESSDSSSDGGSDGGEGDASDSADENEDQITNIFIVPMKGLDVDMDKSRF